MTRSPRELLSQLMDVALKTADPAPRLAELLPAPPPQGGRTLVIGAGKAAANMARAVEQNWPHPLCGLVITRYGHGLPLERIEVIEAGHPMPDAQGRAGAKRLIGMLDGLTERDLVICLISGGGSALLSLPLSGLDMADKPAVNKALLLRGADIAEMNCVRKHLSAIKGGRLAQAAAPARLVTYLVSDVPGDHPSVIASGPTVGDATTQADARAILERYEIEITRSIHRVLNDPANETLKPDDPAFTKTETIMVTKPQDALQAVARRAFQLGLNPLILGDSIEGEAREVAKMHAGIARQVARFDQPCPRPAVLISGGETTVTVAGTGRGGRNTEFLLSLAIALDGLPDTYALAIDTDGIDGSEDNAGAMITPDSLQRAQMAGLQAPAFLAANNAYDFFSGLNDLVITGPTLTNVNDLRLILVL